MPPRRVTMKKGLMVLIFSMVLVFATSYQSWSANDWTGNVNFTLGAKALDEHDWEPVEDQGEFGIHVDFRRPEWPVNIAIALLGSSGEEDIRGTDIEGSTSELRFGVRKIWEPTRTMRPFFGGGLSLMSAEIDVEGFGSDEDSDFGVWISGGIYWTLSNSFNLGFELGFSQGEVDLDGYDVDAGGSHAGLILGYHW